MQDIKLALTQTLERINKAKKKLANGEYRVEKFIKIINVHCKLWFHEYLHYIMFSSILHTCMGT